jgi:hypothetical protein
MSGDDAPTGLRFWSIFITDKNACVSDSCRFQAKRYNGAENLRSFESPKVFESQ